MRIRNKEKAREARKRWREANPEKVKEIYKRWREAHPEKRREINRKYRETNSEKIREAEKNWYNANPEKVKESYKKYKSLYYNIVKIKARNISNKIPIIPICAICGEEGIERHHPDHREPKQFTVLCSKCHVIADKQINWKKQNIIYEKYYNEHPEIFKQDQNEREVNK